ncbi:MAG: hypothetical protein WCV81_02275 [Microgenomates group bacterium]|jgi:hypothetical protein
MTTKSIVSFFDKDPLLSKLISFLRKLKHKLYRLKKAFYYRSSILIKEDLYERDFIFLKKETNKWVALDFENVGNDLYIKIKRLKDGKIFLLDQPFFYTLQLGMTKNASTEVEFVYAVKKYTYNNILKTLKILNLC